MRYELYILPFFISLSLSLIFSMLLIKFYNDNYTSVEKRNEDRHIHKRNLSRMGGIAMAGAFTCTLFFDKNLVISSQLYAIIGSIFILLAVGIWDDLKELNWKKQFIFQIIAVVFIFSLGVRMEYITNPLGGIILLNSPELIFFSMLGVGIWIVSLINAMNWIDGIDGLIGGVAAIGAFSIFLLSLKPEVNQPPVGIVALILAGALLGFLFFNFFPAKIIAGTGGSYFIGFSLAALSIFAGAKIATTLLVFIIPIIDACWVVFERIKFRQSIFNPDKRHLHHKLLEIGWSQRKICFFYYAITAGVAFVALNTKSLNKIIFLLLVTTLIIGFLFLLGRRIRSQNKKLLLN